MKTYALFGALGLLLALAVCSCGNSNGGSNATGPAAPYCEANPASPTCTGTCFANPNLPGCAGWGVCGADPYAPGCAGYCQTNPYAAGCSNGISAGATLAASQGQGTKDTQLQQAQLQAQSLQDRAGQLSNQFGMNLNAATRLTALADRMNQLEQGGNFTDEDRAALTDAALAVAGISLADENAAATALIQSGDHTAVDNLLVKAASNLGMSSPATLRDQILPALGITLPQ